MTWYFPKFSLGTKDNPALTVFNQLQHNHLARLNPVIRYSVTRLRSELKTRIYLLLHIERAWRGRQTAIYLKEEEQRKNRERYVQCFLFKNLEWEK